MSLSRSHAKAVASQSKSVSAEESVDGRAKGKARQSSLDSSEEDDDDDDEDGDDFDEEEDELNDSRKTFASTTPVTTSTEMHTDLASSSRTPPTTFSPGREQKSTAVSSGPFAARPEAEATTSSSTAPRSKKKKRRLDVVANAVGVYLSPASSSVHSKISCSECRASKTRCSGGDVCERCQRLQRECVYKEHRRGHFSDNPRIQHLEQTISTLLSQIRTLQAERGNVASASTAGVALTTPPTQPMTLHTFQPAPSTSPGQRYGNQQQYSATPVLTSASSSFYEPILSPAFVEHQASHDGREHLKRLLSSPLELLAYAKSQIARDFNNSSTSQAVTRPEEEEVSLSSITSAVLYPSVAESKHDHFCPIDKRILTIAQARALLSAFMTHINPQVTLLDAELHSIEYIRSHSSFLLTAVCYVASLFNTELAQVSRDLAQYLQHAVLPAILTTQGGYRSVEIVQSFVLLAHYYPATDRMSDDRSWHYVGHAARIGAELDLNQVVQLSAQQRTNEGLVRRVRNRQRAWLGVWTCEMVLCEQLGRVPLLRVDPLIVSSGTGAGWPGDTPFALMSDSETVSRMQMHMIVLRQMELYERVLVSTSPQLTPATATPTIQDTIHQAYQSATRQLDAWLATWIHIPSSMIPGASIAGAAMSASQIGQRQARARLTYWYVKVLLAMRATQFFSLPQAATDRGSTTTMMTLHRDALQSCLAYLSQYVGLYESTAGTPVTSTPSDSLAAVIMYGSNVSVVAPAYCSVICLHILTRTSTLLAAEERINMPEVFALVLRTADTMMTLSAVTAQRGSAGERYGPLLRAAVGQARAEVDNVGWEVGPSASSAVAARTTRRRKDTGRSEGRGKGVQQQKQRGGAAAAASNMVVPLNTLGIGAGGMGGGVVSAGGVMDVTMAGMLPSSYPLYGHADIAALPPPAPAPLSAQELPLMMTSGDQRQQQQQQQQQQPPPPWDSLAMHYPWPPMYVPQAPPQPQQGGQQVQSPHQQSMLPQQSSFNAGDESLQHLLFSTSFYHPGQQPPPSSSSSTAPPRRPPSPPPGT